MPPRTPGASLARVRLVWAAVTATPHSPVHTLAAALGIAPSSVYAALRALRDAGYIDYPDACHRARVVRVGLYERKPQSVKREERGTHVPPTRRLFDRVDAPGRLEAGRQEPAIPHNQECDS
jgi:DNA-binding transcriptional ArsR family regulator